MVAGCSLPLIRTPINMEKEQKAVMGEVVTIIFVGLLLFVLAGSF